MILTTEMKTWYGMIATFGTLGRFSKMPGTLGSLAGTALWLLFGGIPLWAIAAVEAVGCCAADERMVPLRRRSRSSMNGRPHTARAAAPVLD